VYREQRFIKTLILHWMRYSLNKNRISPDMNKEKLCISYHNYQKTFISHLYLHFKPRYYLISYSARPQWNPGSMLNNDYRETIRELVRPEQGSETRRSSTGAKLSIHMPHSIIGARLVIRYKLTAIPRA